MRLAPVDLDELWSPEQPRFVKVISVVTPVHDKSLIYLRSAFDSLVGQSMPVGWNWEWLVQEDGDVTAAVPHDPRIRVARSRHSGPAIARTLALGRSRGSLIKVLDADDQLTPGALARDIDVMTASPDIGWTTAAALDLFPDGSTAAHDANPDPGPLAADEVVDFWLAHDFRLPVHPATLCIRRDLIMALGGWMALPASEDTGLLIAASVVSPGYFIAEPGMLYRKWPGQMTGQRVHADPTDRAARMAVIQARAETLRTQRDRYAPNAA